MAYRIHERERQMPDSTSQSGQEECFCPVNALTKFPYKFLRAEARRLQQPISMALFDRGQFWERRWDIYYASLPDVNDGEPVMFVPKSQAVDLIHDINDLSDVRVMIKAPNPSFCPGFFVHFEDTSSLLRPQYLGQSTSKDQFDVFVSQARSRPMDLPPDSNTRNLAEFKRRMEEALEAGKRAKKQKAAATEEQKMLKQQGMIQMLKNAQMHLGLRPACDEADLMSHPLHRILLDRPAPCSLYMDVVFVSVDVEAWEANRNNITEIGITVFDTRDIGNEPPGLLGKNWYKLLRYHHFRIKEFKHLRNSKFVPGCPDNFEFGTSEFIAKKDAPFKVAECFRSPFGKISDSFSPSSSSNIGQREERNVVLVGHAVDSDINYLKQIGYDVTNLANLTIADTSSMWRILNREQNPKALGTVLAALDIEGWFLHNAGNDAAYTMQAMISMCFKEAETWYGDPGQAAASEQQIVEERVNIARDEAEQQVRKDRQGWDIGNDRYARLPDAPHDQLERLSVTEQEEKAEQSHLLDEDIPENFAASLQAGSPA